MPFAFDHVARVVPDIAEAVQFIVDLIPGSRVDVCTLVLPSIGTIGVSLSVRSVEDIEEPGGGVRRRVGCGFVGLPPRYEVALQRYIMRLEREGSGRDS